MKTKNLTPTDYNCENWVKEIARFPEFINELKAYQVTKLNDYIKRRITSIYVDLNLRLQGFDQLCREGKIREDQKLPLEQMKPEDLRTYERVYRLIEQHEMKILRDEIHKIQLTEQETNRKGKGFSSNLTDNQIENLHAILIEKGFIDKKTELENFRAIFKDKPLPQNFVKVKWINLNPKRNPNQTSLREFLKASMKIDMGNPSQVIIDNCFTDNKGKSIILSKPRKGPNTETWANRFKRMIPS